MITHKKPGKDSVDSVNRLKGVYIVSGALVEGNHYSLHDEKCILNNTFCIETLNFIYNGDKGQIVYTFYNHNSSAISGEFTLVVGDQSFIIPYRNIAPNYQATGVFGYDGWTIDYTGITDYEIIPGGVEEHNAIFDNLSQEDKDRIVAFYNPQG